MSEQAEKVFVGFVTEKELSWGTVTQIAFKQEDLDKLKSLQNESGYVNLQMKRGKSGKLYIEHDSWTPNAGKAGQGTSGAKIANPAEVEDDLPF